MYNFQPLPVVDRGSETEFQVVENVNKFTQQDKVKTKPTYPGTLWIGLSCYETVLNSAASNMYLAEVFSYPIGVILAQRWLKVECCSNALTAEWDRVSMLIGFLHLPTQGSLLPKWSATSGAASLAVRKMVFYRRSVTHGNLGSSDRNILGLFVHARTHAQHRGYSAPLLYRVNPKGSNFPI